MKRWLAGALAVGVAALGCKPGGLTTEDVERLVDARLAARGIGAPSASGSSSANSASSAPSSEDGPAAASLKFLARLDKLMEDYAPTDKESLLRCVTSDALKSTPELKKASESVQQERKRKAEEFYSTVYPLAFHYDLDWQTRGAKSPPVFGCWVVTTLAGHSQTQATDGSWDNTTKPECSGKHTSGPAWAHDTFEYTWKVKQPEGQFVFRYTGIDKPPTQPPELMHRMEAASIKPLPRFSCLVDDVVSEKEHKTVKCVSSMTTASLRITGELKPINTGDLVSVPLAATKRDPDGVLFKHDPRNKGDWVVDADAASLTVDAAATCPSMDEILASVGNGGSTAAPKGPKAGRKK